MGHAFAGRGATSGPLSTDWSGIGPGRSATVKCRRVPGDSCSASVNAACPVSTGCFAASSAANKRAEDARRTAAEEAKKGRDDFMRPRTIDGELESAGENQRTGRDKDKLPRA